MSDRIAVMNEGASSRRRRRATIYEEPRTVFVADFLGVSNLLAAEAVGPDGDACTVRVGDRTLRAQQGAIEARGEVKVMIRPERIGIEPHASAGDERLPGIVERSVFLGGSHEVHVRVLGGELLKAMVANDGKPPAVALEPGAAVSVHLPPDGLRVLRTSEPEEEGKGDGDQQEEPAATATQAYAVGLRPRLHEVSEVRPEIAVEEVVGRRHRLVEQGALHELRDELGGNLRRGSPALATSCRKPSM